MIVTQVCSNAFEGARVWTSSGGIGPGGSLLLYALIWVPIICSICAANADRTLCSVYEIYGHIGIIFPYAFIFRSSGPDRPKSRVDSLIIGP